MREFRSQNTGKLHISNEYWLKNCPVCNSKLLWNSYSDKGVSSDDDKKFRSFDLKIEYCEKCDDYYVYIL